MHPRDLASLAGEETIFGGFAAEKLERLQAELEPLSGRYDVVVANPPYMGSKNMNKWLGDWVKTHHKDVKGDLFSCFMVRNVGMGAEHAQLGFMTPYVWMFIGTYEKLRKFVIQQNTITSLIQLEYSGFSGATVPICTFTLQKGYCPGYRGGYVRLSDFVGADQQAPRALEALANPDCGWFYRADATEFKVIPGTPIAYWASKSLYRSFSLGTALREYVEMPYGFKTGDNDRFLRMWWECSMAKLNRNAVSADCAAESLAKWFPYNKGGSYRKWYGNNEYVLNYENNGNEVIGMAIEERRNASDYSRDLLFKPVVTWSRISSGRLHMRYSSGGAICDMTGSGYYGPLQTLEYLQAFCNSSIAMQVAEVLSPTLDYQPGQIGSYPIIIGKQSDVELLTNENISTAKQDWDYFESSWDFMKHPLI